MDRKKRLRDVTRHSSHDFDVITDFTPRNGIVDATEIFMCKKEDDQWWKDAIDRINNLGKPVYTDKK